MIFPKRKVGDLRDCGLRVPSKFCLFSFMTWTPSVFATTRYSSGFIVKMSFFGNDFNQDFDFCGLQDFDDDLTEKKKKKNEKRNQLTIIFDEILRNDCNHFNNYHERIAIIFKSFLNHFKSF